MKRLGIALMVVLGLYGTALAATAQESFESIDDAVNALVGAFRTVNRKALMEILGAIGRPLVESGDNVGDREAFERFVAD